MNLADFDPQNIRIGPPVTHANGATTFSISYVTTPLPVGIEGPVKEEPLMFRCPILSQPVEHDDASDNSDNDDASDNSDNSNGDSDNSDNSNDNSDNSNGDNENSNDNSDNSDSDERIAR